MQVPASQTSWTKVISPVTEGGVAFKSKVAEAPRRMEDEALDDPPNAKMPANPGPASVASTVGVGQSVRPGSCAHIMPSTSPVDPASPLLPASPLGVLFPGGGSPPSKSPGPGCEHAAKKTIEETHTAIHARW